MTEDLEDLEDLEDWAKKCISCIHCYKKKDDADYLYCRLKNGCRYETKRIQKKKGVRNEKTRSNNIYS